MAIALSSSSTKRLESTDGDEMSGKFFCFFFITHRVPVSNCGRRDDEIITGMTRNYMKQIILLEVHSVQETFSGHEDLA